MISEPQISASSLYTSFAEELVNEKEQHFDFEEFLINIDTPPNSSKGSPTDQETREAVAQIAAYCSVEPPPIHTPNLYDEVFCIDANLIPDSPQSIITSPPTSPQQSITYSPERVTSSPQYSPGRGLGGKGRIMNATTVESENEASDDSDSDTEDEKPDSDTEGDSEDDDAPSSIISLDEPESEFGKIRILPKRTTSTLNSKRPTSVVLIKTLSPLKNDLQTKMPAGPASKDGKWIPKTYDHKYISTDKIKSDKIVEICEVEFDERAPDSDTTMVYSKDLNLVSLKNMISGYTQKTNFIQNKMVKTQHGAALKTLSTEYPIAMSIYSREKVNNASLTNESYPLVYGAVPNKIAFDYASYILLKYYKFKIGDQETAPLLGEGDLELGAYCYTLLVTQDLVNWKNDTNRSELKKLLLYACGRIPDATLRRTILAYAQSVDSKYISAECMLFIKMNYSQIITLLRKSNDDDKTEAMSIWHCFMEKSGVHHHLCPHTLKEVSKGMKLISKKLVAKLDDLKLENASFDLTGIKYTFDEINTLFAFILYQNQATATSMKNVQKSTNSLCTHIIKMFADHLVDTGVYPTSTTIVVDHVLGFIKKHNKLLSVNNENLKLPIIESKFTTITNILSLRVQSVRDCEKPLKMDKSASALLMHTLNMIILKRVEPLCYNQDRDLSIGDEIYNQLQSIFESNEFTSIGDIEAWTRVDDSDDDDCDYDMEFQQDCLDDEAEQQSKKHNESGDESESGSDSDDELELGEIEDLKSQMYRDFVHPPAPTPVIKKPRVKKNAATAGSPRPSGSGIKKVTNRNYLQVIHETPYAIRPTNCSRVQCTMCFVARTQKVLIVNQLEIPCCKKCIITLVVDYKSDTPAVNHTSILERLNKRCRRPVAFKNGVFIPDNEFDFTAARNDYDLATKNQRPTKRKSPTTKSAGGKNAKKAKIETTITGAELGEQKIKSKAYISDSD